MTPKRPVNNHDHYTLPTILTAFESFNPDRGVDKINNQVREIIFGDNLLDGNIEDFENFVTDFTALYYFMKKKFKKINRKISGERYFEHLRGVVYNVLKLPNPNIDKVLISIAHDCIEDTDVTYEGLNEGYGYKIALSVQAISKESWKNYLEDLDDKNEDSIKEAKRKRNHVYYSHLESFDAMSEHINSIAISKGVELSSEELKEITQNTLDVKFADRIHNLATQRDPNNLNIVRKKVDETKLYFLTIAKETNTVAYKRLKSLVLELEIRLSLTSKKVNKILKGEDF